MDRDRDRKQGKKGGKRMTEKGGQVLIGARAGR